MIHNPCKVVVNFNSRPKGYGSKASRSMSAHLCKNNIKTYILIYVAFVLKIGRPDGIGYVVYV